MPELTPVEIAEEPWVDPWDGLLTGSYRARVAGARPEDVDHQVVYIRGGGGDPTAEYRAPAAICGAEVDMLSKPLRLGARCPACVAGIAGAFDQARAAMARDAAAPGELG